MLQPQLVPLQIDAWSPQGVFLPSPGHTWQHDGYYAKLKSEMCPINDALLNNTHPRGMNTIVKCYQFIKVRLNSAFNCRVHMLQISNR